MEKAENHVGSDVSTKEVGVAANCVPDPRLLSPPLTASFLPSAAREFKTLLCFFLFLSLTLVSYTPSNRRLRQPLTSLSFIFPCTLPATFLSSFAL